MRSCLIIAGFGASLVLSACGSQGPRQDASEPKGKFPVAVEEATFPTTQTLSQHAQLTIAVRNTGHKTIPDIAVTVCNVTCSYPASTSQGSGEQAFSEQINQKYLANPSRPIWIVDVPPGPGREVANKGGAGGNITAHGQGGDVTAYANTWAAGALPPGKTVLFDWKVTAVSPGQHTVAWEVAAGLNGKATAVLSDGSGPPKGSFAVTINPRPQEAYVNNAGQIVVGANQQP